MMMDHCVMFTIFFSVCSPPPVPGLTLPEVEWAVGCPFVFSPLCGYSDPFCSLLKNHNIL